MATTPPTDPTPATPVAVQPEGPIQTKPGIDLSPSGQPRIPESNREQVRLSLRIVVHLDRFGSVGEGGIARLESTQQGIAGALSVTQGAVSKVLRRLVAADVIHQERRHVRGVDRRVRAYSLSWKGQSLVLEMRQRAASSPKAGDAGAR